MKSRKPKPVVLEPAHVSLLRLGREMGSSDVPAAELAMAPIWSVEASRAVDRILDAAAQDFYDQIDDDRRRGITLSKRCMSCGAICAVYGVRHADDCDLDRSLTPEQRYKLRNPRHSVKNLRIMAIKARWALMNGRCGTCWKRPRDNGKNRCVECSGRASVRSAERYFLRKQADQAEAARAA